MQNNNVKWITKNTGGNELLYCVRSSNVIVGYINVKENRYYPLIPYIDNNFI